MAFRFWADNLQMCNYASVQSQKKLGDDINEYYTNHKSVNKSGFKIGFWNFTKKIIWKVKNRQILTYLIWWIGDIYEWRNKSRKSI